MQQLILASTSPYRRRLLDAAGIEVRVEAPGVDESEVKLTDPVALARELARRKAAAIAARHPGAWVLGADQVAYALDAQGNPDGEPFGKPLDPEDHLRRLKSMVGRRHALVTGFALLDPGEQTVRHETTVLKFRDDLEEAELAAYVASGEGSGCSGGYAADGRGVFLIERIEGDWSNVIGLPVLAVLDLLRARGWRFR
jgi:septum formation protein